MCFHLGADLGAKRWLGMLVWEGVQRVAPAPPPAPPSHHGRAIFEAPGLLAFPHPSPAPPPFRCPFLTKFGSILSQFWYQIWTLGGGREITKRYENNVHYHGFF